MAVNFTQASGVALADILKSKNNDEMGEIIFQGRNDNSEDVHYGRIVGKIAQAANGTEKGNIEFKIMENGTEATFVQMAFDNVFINKWFTHIMKI